MSTRYFLKNTHNPLDSQELPIHRLRFGILEKSQSILMNALYIEEKYEIIIKNYSELEGEALRILTSNMLRSSPRYSEFFDVKLGLNIQLINLLTVVRLYRDQLDNHVKKCLFGKADIKDTISKYCSDEYDKCFEYQFMEALRNYVQHNGLPVHKTSMPMKKKKIGEEDEYLQFSLSFSASKDVFIKDKKFKASVLNEMPDEVDLWAASKKYVECVSRVHMQVRELIKDDVNLARSEMDKALSEYQLTTEGTVYGVTAYELLGAEIKNKTPIFLEWDDIRKQLLVRNRTPLNLGARYVSSYPQEK